ncbi:Response regulator receiver domain-containing protein [Filimonas lacunae]|uniref:Response regulator receiver domain-containing protein n=1 Tax=Filimonas lacunae TaxID=477680 RepID=A0A173MHG6_9BACT|nr:sigma-54-dependent Fis family transcriptional regulator [Filimonas lacunae]BAV06936.1 formate hydrogenlyase transcriptional activator [Filimonas lacunae]SIS97564.1 Response regulator receiver domain-containing protein [Filimonas lacunae]
MITGTILIVEDEFIVATDLTRKLTKAGYEVCAVATSVAEATELIQLHQPAWAILDIFLMDGSLGTQLAEQLVAKNIGFLYLSASQDIHIIEKARLTNPYGFLVKPFKEQDLLMMLEIAIQKHQHQLQLAAQREMFWQQNLQLLNGEQTPVCEKIKQVPGFFQSAIPFDYMHISTTTPNSTHSHRYGFLRKDFNHYQVLEQADILTIIDEQAPLHWQEQFMHYYNFCSHTTWNTVLENKEKVLLSFYSRSHNAYTGEHLSFLQNHALPLQTFLQLLLKPLPPAASPGPGAVMPDTSHKDEKPSFTGIIGKSPALLRVLDHIATVAPSPTSVLITGESGTGKERVAKAIHQLSDRRHKPLVVINCAALPADLIEPELFGHEKGAFTGAHDKRAGKFELAHGGTLFLDEVGELSLAAQMKLLRVLQEREVERIGANKTFKVDVRVIAATNRKLEEAVAAGRFRLDLYFRLNVYQIILPPLRERQEDIPLLAAHFTKMYSTSLKKPPVSISSEAMQTLMHYPWPGNVRELAHTIERSVLLTRGYMMREIILPQKPLATDFSFSVINAKATSNAANEADYLVSILKLCKGKIRGEGGAASYLGIPATTLQSRMKKLGIKKVFDFE